jgi:hypothetical protein
MYCAKLKQFVYQCLPERLKRLKGEFAFLFFSILPSHLYPSRNFLHQLVKYNICLQYFIVPFLYRAKKLSYLGLLALFFGRLKWNH